MYAAGITAYDDERNPIEDPEIGTIKLYYKNWDVAKENDILKFTEIPTRPCTLEDFGNNKIFYPIKETSEADMHKYWRKLKCVDKNTVLEIFGRYETQAA